MLCQDWQWPLSWYLAEPVRAIWQSLEICQFLLLMATGLGILVLELCYLPKNLQACFLLR
jgi:hypothetical protein